MNLQLHDPSPILDPQMSLQHPQRLAHRVADPYRHANEPQRVEGRLLTDQEAEVGAVGSLDAMQEKPPESFHGHEAVGIVEKPGIEARFRDGRVRVSPELAEHAADVLGDAEMDEAGRGGAFKARLSAGEREGEQLRLGSRAMTDHG